MLTTSSPLKIAAFLVIYGSLHLQAHTGTIEGQFHANIGGKVVLPCSTTLDSSVDWRYHYSPFESPTFVFSNRQMYDSVPKRIYVNITKVGTATFYNMTITNASSTDSGLYTCAEDGGLGHRHTYSLLVDEENSATSDVSCNTTGYIVGIAILAIVAIAAVIAVVAVFIWLCIKARKNQACKSKDHQSSLNRMTDSGDEENATHGVTRGLLEKGSGGDNGQQEQLQTSSGSTGLKELLPMSYAIDQHPKIQHISCQPGGSLVEGQKHDNRQQEQNPTSSESSTANSETASNKLSDVGLPVFTTCGSTDRGNKVRDICVLGNDVYVIREAQSEVQIYNRLSLKSTRSLPVSDDKYPGCMTLDSVDKCLYITYYKSQAIRRVPLDGKNVTEWKTSSMPDGICVAANSRNVIVALREADKVVQYTPGGVVVREIALIPGTNPRSVLSIQGDKLYVCVGFGSGYVCLLGNDGSMKKIGTMTSHPLGMAIDRRGNFLVADLNDGKVVLLDSNMNYVSDAIPKTNDFDLACPFKLCFDENCEILYVGELRQNGRVLAYSVNYTN